MIFKNREKYMATVAPVGIYIDRNVSNTVLNHLRTHGNLENIPGVEIYPLAHNYTFQSGNYGTLVYLHSKFEEIAISKEESEEIFSKICKSTVVSPLNELNPTEKKKALKDRRCAAIVIKEGILSQIQVHEQWHKKIAKANALQLILRLNGKIYNPEQETAELVPVNKKEYNKLFS